MQLKKANGKNTLTISRQEWTDIGRQQGWMKTAKQTAKQLREVQEALARNPSPTIPVPLQQAQQFGGGGPRAVAPVAPRPAAPVPMAGPIPSNPAKTPKPSGPNMPVPPGNPAMMAGSDSTPQSQMTPYISALENAKRSLSNIVEKPNTPQDVAKATEIAGILEQMARKLRADCDATPATSSPQKDVA